MRALRNWLTTREARETLVRVAAIALFLVLLLRFWHPHHGFTRFLQLDAATAPLLPSSLREAPVFVHAVGGYDGLYYAQLATDPTLRDPGLAVGMDNFAYRARRILPPLLAHVVAGGDPVDAVRAYAWLNVVAWLALAAIAWRILPTGDWARTAAWLGLLFSAGALHSVRLALVDLPALLFLALGWLAWERERWAAAAAALALAALARETSILAAGVLALHLAHRAGLIRAVAWLAFTLAPLALWLLWVRHIVGHTGAGWDNLRFPASGLLWKWRDGLTALGPGAHHALRLTTALATLALTAQLARFARPDWRDPLWGLGAAFGVLALALGMPVWEGHPGAATRVLLPLTFAFFVAAGRSRPSWTWLAVGSLTIPAGLIFLGHVPQDPHELSAGRASGGTYLVRTASGFHAVERSGNHSWAWSGERGELELRTWPAAAGPRAVTLEVTGLTPRPLRIMQHGAELWSGEVGPRRRTIDLPRVAFVQGRAALELGSSAEPLRAPGDTRELGFAVHGATVR